MFIFSESIDTPIGQMLACANHEGICLLEFVDRKDIKKQKTGLQNVLKTDFAEGSNEHLNALKLQLGEYFSGDRETFNLPLVMTGTQFQEKVWNSLQDIPFGKTLTYQSLTNQLGDPRAIRAVANANGANKMAILIPCHRVIGSDGSLTGYAGGLSRKQWLLDHENKQLTLSF